MFLNLRPEGGILRLVSSVRRVHPAWVVLGAVTLCMMAGSGIRSTFGVYIKPMEAEFGWGRGALSGAAAISLLLLGAAGPLVGRLADRYGPRRIVTASLLLLGAGSVGAAFVQSLWHVYVTIGLFLALGAGGLSTPTAATVAARWFEARRGVAIGIAAGGMSAGQLVVIPLAMGLTLWLGWRMSYLWLGVTLLALAVPVALFFVRDDPADRGVRPYGATGTAVAAAQAAAIERSQRISVLEALKVPQFWLLMATFFICGYTANGMVLTHFMPHALEHNFSELQASTALGVMGAMNVLGTFGSGWICDRFGRRGPLAFYYFVRGLSLLFLLYVWDAPSLHVWAAVYGLNYISTVPPTTTLTANIFGRYSVGELSGWIFLSHQVGSALGAALAGWIYEWTGGYEIAFVSAALMGFLAAGLALAIREEPVASRPTPLAAPATS
ncbi:MAG: MFS transporter [Candidatus Rokuibacteriota bacterium]|nr:MAG: MFS transporter [Candidatus Rokubacteria bacterium]